MKYNEGAQLDPSQMGGGGRWKWRQDRGRRRRRLIVLLIALLFGLNPGDILGGAPGRAGAVERQPVRPVHSRFGHQPNRDCRFVAYTNSIQNY